LTNFLTVNDAKIEATASTVVNHIQQFNEYVGEDGTSMFDWIRNPFECILTDLTARKP